jgi:hypothetical protein
MLGFQVGIQRGFVGVDKSMGTAADGVVKSAKDKFSQVPDALHGIFDVQPVITPVLDLTHVKKHASALSDMLPDSVIVARTSIDQASVISDQKASVDASKIVSDVHAKPSTVTFNQNNYSPEPLRTIEIYRQTNNQLDKAKNLVGSN